MIRWQESLREVIASISSELALRPLLTLIVRHACELLDADRGSIGLVDEDRNLIRTEAIYKMPEDELGAEMPPGVGLAGQVLQTQQPIVFDHYAGVDRPTQPELLQDAVIGLPIFWHERMIGFFGIGAAPPRSFTAQDVEILTHVGRHAAIAIENARLYEREKQRTKRFELIARVGQRMAARLNSDELFTLTVEDLHNTLNYDHVSLFLLDRHDPGWLVQHARASRWRRGEAPGYRQSIQEGILGLAARQRMPQLVNDVQAAPHYVAVPNADSLRAELAVPILLGDRLLGILDVAGTSHFHQEDVTALQVVADELAVAIDNAQLFARREQALAETHLLYKTSERISTAMDVDGVIAAYLAQVADRRRYACTVVLYAFNEAGERTAVVIRGRWAPNEGLIQEKKQFPYTRDALDPLLDTGETLTFSNVHTDPRVSAELRQIQSASKRPALAMIPLLARGQRIGLVILSHPDVHEWKSDDLQPYQVTAAQLAIAIDSRRQQNLLHENSRQMAILQERQHLARELHDSVTQLIFSMTLIAQSIAPAWQRSPAEGEQRVNRLLELSQSALAEMRALLAELRPVEPEIDVHSIGDNRPLLPDSALNQLQEPNQSTTATGLARLQQQGLAAALRHYAREIAGEGLSIEINTEQYHQEDIKSGRRPLEVQEKAIYRIAQEALNNVIKHAQARHVQITLAVTNDYYQLTVTDDGRGFDLPSEEARVNFIYTGFGLKTMHERAKDLNGELHLTSEPNRGTTVAVTIPVK